MYSGLKVGRAPSCVVAQLRRTRRIELVGQPMRRDIKDLIVDNLLTVYVNRS